jgi:2-desacetyl-2-hydroxyethyl bacteriochlorophyllide A dehydrogenase
MKSAVYVGPKQVVVKEVDPPSIGPTDILVRVRACGICGSDLHSYEDGSYIELGQVMGHEFSGDVVEVGKEVRNIETDDRITAHPLVYCYECPMCLDGLYTLCPNKFNQSVGYGLPGAFAEYVRIPKAKLDHNVFRLPEGVSYEQGALVEPLSTAIHAVQLAESKIGKDLAVVFGAGAIGLFVLQTLRNLSPFKVVVSEISARRLEVAQELGADAVINPKVDDFAKIIAGIGATRGENLARCVDLVMECVGSAPVTEQALAVIKPAGRIVLVGLGPKMQIDITFLVQNQIRLQGAFAFLDEFGQAIELIRSKKVQVDPMISHRFTLEETKQAFDIQSNSDASVKVLVCP